MFVAFHAQGLLARQWLIRRPLGWFVLLGSLASWPASCGSTIPVMGLVPMLAFGGFVFGVLLLMDRKITHFRNGTLLVDQGGVWTNGRLFAKAPSINESSATTAYYEVDRGRLAWLLVGRRRLGINVGAPEASIALLQELRTVLRARVAFRGVSLRGEAHQKAKSNGAVLVIFGYLVLSTLAGGLLLRSLEGLIVGFVFGLLLAPLIAGALYVGLVELLRERFILGADGIEVRQLPKRTVISFAEVHAVERRRSDVTISFRTGRPPLVIGFGDGNIETWQHIEQANMALWVLGAAVATFHKSIPTFQATMDGASYFVDHAEAAALADEHGGNALSILARGGRSVSAWLRALRHTRETHATFRNMTLQLADLMRIAEDPAQPETIRAGAALALRGDLGSSLDPASRERLRLAAEACVEPRLRVALETCAMNPEELSEDVLEASFDRLIEEPEAAKQQQQQARLR